MPSSSAPHGGIRHRGGISGNLRELMYSLSNIGPSAQAKVKPSLSFMRASLSGQRVRMALRLVAIVVLVGLFSVVFNSHSARLRIALRGYHYRERPPTKATVPITPQPKLEDYPDIFVADSVPFRPPVDADGDDTAKLGGSEVGGAGENPAEGVVDAAAPVPAAEEVISPDVAAGKVNKAAMHGGSGSSAIGKRTVHVSVPAKVERVVPSGVDETAEPIQRVIVLTMNRDASLTRLLNSLTKSEYDGDRIDLDVWVDHPPEGAKPSAHEETDRVVAAARACEWPHGVRSIYTRTRNAGLYEQWIYTWNVTDESTEAVVILEDDLEVSEKYYLWLKRARAAYASDPSIAALTLQRGELRPRQIRGVATGKLRVNARHPVFKYQLLGTWGFAPQKAAWLEFRAWYEEMRAKKAKPYVDHLMTTDWYKAQEKAAGGEVATTMWSQWFIKFSDVKHYFTLYANLADGTTLATNWREGGMHYSNKPPSRDFSTFIGDPTEFSFPEKPIHLDWSGQEIQRDQSFEQQFVRDGDVK
jgi:hypothetical protein